jgi:hypothetical protein
VARAMPKKNKKRGGNDGDGAAPLLNRYDRWRTAGRGRHAAAWSAGWHGGTDAAVGRCRVVGTGPELAGVGGQCHPMQNRGGGVAAW